MRTYDLGRVLAERDAYATLDVELLQRSVTVIAQSLQRPRNGAVRPDAAPRCRGGARNPLSPRLLRSPEQNRIRGSRREQSLPTEKVRNRARRARVDGIHGCAKSKLKDETLN